MPIRCNQMSGKGWQERSAAGAAAWGMGWRVGVVATASFKSGVGVSHVRFDACADPLPRACGRGGGRWRSGGAVGRGVRHAAPSNQR